jgi:hypothetical protein
MDRVTQQNAAMVEETTAASHNLTGETKTLSQTLQRFVISNASPRRSPQLTWNETAPSHSKRMLEKLSA